MKLVNYLASVEFWVEVYKLYVYDAGMSKNKIKIRKSWGDMSPVTRKIESKTKYNRARTNRENREE